MHSSADAAAAPSRSDCTNPDALISATQSQEKIRIPYFDSMGTRQAGGRRISSRNTLTSYNSACRPRNKYLLGSTYHTSEIRRLTISGTTTLEDVGMMRGRLG